MNNERDYLKEAMAILAGQSRMLPQKEHLEALHEQLRRTVGNLEKTAQALAGVMLMGDITRLPVREEIVQQILRSRTGVFVESQQGQGLLIHRVQRERRNLVTPQAGQKVM